jgi:hypothetical protein
LARHDDRLIGITAFQRCFPNIQAQSRLTALLVRPVAGETVLRKNRLHLSRKIRPGHCSLRDERTGKERGQQHWESCQPNGVSQSSWNPWKPVHLCLIWLT